MSSLMAPVFEIFSGIQGEGVLVGVRQVFVRFCGCNRHCRFCDTREACETPPATCSVETKPGGRRFERWRNPMMPDDIARAVARLEPDAELHHSVSLTGGEPLLHPEAIAALGPMLRGMGLKTFLETNGTLPDALEQVLTTLDYVAMDVKLESATGEPTEWETHRRFLELAATRDVQVKTVVTGATTDAELERLGALVAAAAPDAPLVLQPVTAMPGILPPSSIQVLAMQQRLRRQVADVRVIPQVHKLMGQK